MLYYVDEPLLMDDAFFQFAAKLEAAGINYMLTGSLALCFHAEPRDTNDVDVVIEAYEAQLEAILAMFPMQEGWYWSEDAARQAASVRSMFNVINSLSGFKFDIIFKKMTEFECVKFSRRMRFAKGSRGLWIITPEDLVVSKLQWGLQHDSAIQAEDVCTLLRDVKDMDMDYINAWVSRLGLEDRFERIRSG